jgi:hypothetical protein
VAERPPDAGRWTLRRGASAFGRFWWDFLVGDTPELFVGAVLGVVLVGLLCLDHSLRTVAAVLLPLWVIGLLAVSLQRAKRARTR